MDPAALAPVVGMVTIAVVGILAVVRTFSGRFDEMGRRFDDVNQRFDDVNQRFDDVNHRIGDLRADLGGRMDRLERQLETVVAGVQDHGERLTRVEARDS